MYKQNLSLQNSKRKVSLYTGNTKSFFVTQEKKVCTTKTVFHYPTVFSIYFYIGVQFFSLHGSTNTNFLQTAVKTKLSYTSVQT